MKTVDPRADLSRKLLLCCRNALYSLFPFLDGAFASLPCEESPDTRSIGLQGSRLLYSPDYLIALYASGPEKLRRGYLHILLHGLYLHPFRRKDRDLRLWNLACDLAVEQIIEGENRSSLAMGEDPVRTRCFQVLGCVPRAAEEIYGLLEQGAFPDCLGAMEAAFLFDDHSLWALAGPESKALWEHILSYTSQNRRGGGHAGTRAGDDQEVLEDLEQGTFPYRKYLRRFAVPREELELDMDSFDYIYYNLGLEQYGNMPLMEPLEYREGQKLEQLVIAIDTSGSCSRETVREFLMQTYDILSDRENFFRKMEVYFIQCDCMIQSVAVIHSREEWQNYSRSVTIEGRGGTDFTPVFRYVAQLQSQGKLRNLKGLLYFTDGDGCYPRVKPPYEAAFVFRNRDEFMEAAPAWAVKLRMESGEST